MGSLVYLFAERKLTYISIPVENSDKCVGQNINRIIEKMNEVPVIRKGRLKSYWNTAFRGGFFDL